MLRAFKLATIFSVSSVALLAAPVFVGGAGSLDLPGISAYAAKGGNSDDDRGGGNGGGQSEESHGNSGESHGNSGDSHGNSTKSDVGAAVQSSGGKKATAPGGASGDLTVATKKAPATKKSSTELSEQNFHARLAGLNSLKRNRNGLMNSSDPRMEAIRAYVEAGPALEIALAELEQAISDLADAQDAYLLLVEGLEFDAFDGNPDAYGDLSPSALQDRLTALEELPLLETDPLYDDWLAEIADLEAAIGSLEADELEIATTAFEEATDAADAATAAAGDEALKNALLLAANDNRLAQYGDEYVTDEILAWAKSVLGVSDAGGAIDVPPEQQ